MKYVVFPLYFLAAKTSKGRDMIEEKYCNITFRSSLKLFPNPGVVVTRTILFLNIRFCLTKP